MMLRMIAKFSVKKGNFFWTEVNPCVKEAEYAVRGVVPTLANTMQSNIKKGLESTNYLIKNTPSMRSPSATLATPKNSTKNLSLSSEKSYPACSIRI